MKIESTLAKIAENVFSATDFTTARIMFVEHVGATNIKDKVKMIDNLILFQFGHIHEANGVFKIDNGPLLVNASVLNRNYDMTNIPYNITLDKDKKIIDIK